MAILLKDRVELTRATPTFSDARQSAGNAAQIIRALPNVHFVTIGQKRVRGLRTREPALVVYVKKKQQVPADDLIPKTIRISGQRGNLDMKTDVVELKGALSAFNVRAGNVLLASDQMYGICTLAFMKGSGSYLITNAHVAYNIPAGGTPCELSVMEPVTNRLILVGSPVWMSGLSPNQVAQSDAAVIRTDGSLIDPYQITGFDQRISGTSHFVPGNTTYWFMWNGVEFNCSYPEPATHPTVVDVEGVAIEYADFWTLQMTKGASAPGMSGALICRTDPGDKVVGCGIAFGGSAPDILLAYSFDNVFQDIYSLL